MGLGENGTCSSTLYNLWGWVGETILSPLGWALNVNFVPLSREETVQMGAQGPTSPCSTCLVYWPLSLHLHCAGSGQVGDVHLIWRDFMMMSVQIVQGLYRSCYHVEHICRLS